MFTNRISQHLSGRQMTQVSGGPLDVQVLSAGFVFIPVHCVPVSVSYPTAASMLYQFAHHAALQDARDRLLTLLRSRRDLIQRDAG